MFDLNFSSDIKLFFAYTHVLNLYYVMCEMPDETELPK